MPNTTSVFYQIGQNVNSAVNSRFNTFIAQINTFTAEQIFSGGLTVNSSVLDVNAGANINTLAVEDLTDGRVVFAGPGGEIKDNANLAFDDTTNTLTVANLNVVGTTTSVSTTNTEVSDTVITLNKGGADSLINAGILIEKSDPADISLSNPVLLWDDTDGRWAFGSSASDGSTAASIADYEDLAVKDLVIVTDDPGSGLNAQALGNLADFNAGLIA